MRYFYLTFSIIFLLFGIVQLNDPDPFLWFGVYLLISIICFLAFRRKFFPIVTAVIVIACLVWAVYLFPPSWQDWWLLEEESQSLHMKMPGVEEARESLGLILSALILVAIFIHGRRLNKSNII